MDGIALDEYIRQHPEVTVCRVGGVYRAWKAAADHLCGAESHAETAGQLLEKLIRDDRKTAADAAGG